MPDLPDWAKDALEGVTALQVVLWILGLALIIWTAIKLWPLIRNAVAIVDALIQLPKTVESLESLSDKVDVIKHEVLPNGGGSLKDTATETQKAVAALAVDVAHIKRQQASTKTTLARTSRKLDEHLTTSKE